MGEKVEEKDATRWDAILYSSSSAIFNEVQLPNLTHFSKITVWLFYACPYTNLDRRRRSCLSFFSAPASILAALQSVSHVTIRSYADAACFRDCSSLPQPITEVDDARACGSIFVERGYHIIYHAPGYLADVTKIGWDCNIYTVSKSVVGVPHYYVYCDSRYSTGLRSSLTTLSLVTLPALTHFVKIYMWYILLRCSPVFGRVVEVLVVHDQYWIVSLIYWRFHSTDVQIWNKKSRCKLE